MPKKQYIVTRQIAPSDPTTFTPLFPFLAKQDRCLVRQVLSRVRHIAFQNSTRSSLTQTAMGSAFVGFDGLSFLFTFLSGPRPRCAANRVARPAAPEVVLLHNPSGARTVGFHRCK